ncbi:hypothetical protein CPB84DRAFT_1854280 [Gymnopilus junonius]|uniref:Uncharacterized protein n=1 Tax=Gymnopilus junonius TaxID=109634 RepID=A0A9P5NAC6_GYMJU|nr:hypothetical protein CPB84DRAFT_1854280 [Gymnopilus junonius]
MVALFVELINKIVEELDGDEPSLSACSLTSHSLLLMCRPIRFHKLSIDPVEHNAPYRMRQLSEMASIIIPHVRTLTLHWSNKIPSQSLDYTLNTILFIGKLTELQLRGRYKAVATSMVVDLAMMESLRTLSIDRLTDIPASIICNRPKLARFEIHNSSVSTILPFRFQDKYAIHGVYDFDLLTADENGVQHPYRLFLSL